MEEDLKKKFERELEALTTIRDELKVKAHLAKKDVKDEFEQLESKLHLAEEELQRTAGHAKTEAERIGHDVKELLLDLKKGYDSVRRRLV